MITEQTLIDSRAYISTGSETKLYTLRVASRYKDEVTGKVITHTEHIRNLSSNREKAIEKATEYCSSTNTTFAYDGELFELNKITRTSQADKEAMAKLEAEQAEAAAEQAAAEALAEAQYVEYEFNVLFTKGVYQCGRYTGQTPSEVWAFDPSYVRYTSNLVMSEHRTKHDINIKISKAFFEQNPRLVSEGSKSNYVGEVDEKLNIKVKVIKSYTSESFYGTNRCIHMVDVDGNRFVCYTTSSKLTKLEIGQRVEIEGFVVKKHTHYREDGENIKVTQLGGRVGKVAIL